MKLREPQLKPPTELKGDKQTRQGVVKTFRVTTLTPIYGGGVIAGEPDKEMPVRAASIRGQLRFWWRLLHRQPDSTELFIEERRVWGGMSEAEQDYASKVKIRVNHVQDCQIQSFTYPDQLRIPPYAIGVLMSGRNGLEVIAPGMGFDLRVECANEGIWNQIHNALRWWVSFGGLGARTRRGFGALRVDGLDPVRPDEVTSKSCRLALKPLTGNALLAWKQAIQPLEQFRQGENVGRNPKSAGSRVPGRSRWPEPDSIREIVGQCRQKADGTEFRPIHPARLAFPRAMFGMPVNFHFKNIWSNRANEIADVRYDPADVALRPCDLNRRVDYERLASPLILKPIALDNSKFAPAALLLPFAHIQTIDLVLENSGARARNRNLPQTLRTGEWWPIEPAAAQAKAHQIHALKDRTSDGNPLLAFLNFFETGH